VAHLRANFPTGGGARVAPALPPEGEVQTAKARRAWLVAHIPGADRWDSAQLMRSSEQLRALCRADSRRALADRVQASGSRPGEVTFVALSLFPGETKIQQAMAFLEAAEPIRMRELDHAAKVQAAIAFLRRSYVV